jgi:selenocysteine lyase/cysteine desulfurase
MVGLAGLLAGVKYLEEVGVEKIRQHELELNQLLMDQLRTIPDVILHGPEAEAKVAITSISLKSLDTAELGQILGKKFGIMVRTGLHCSPLIHQHLSTKEQGTVRFSLGWANTVQDVESAVNAVREIAQTIYGRNS